MAIKTGLLNVEGAHIEASEPRDKRWIRDMARDYLAFDMRGLHGTENQHPQLKHDWPDFKITEWDYNKVQKLPKQGDCVSCGLYTLKFMEHWTGSYLPKIQLQVDGDSGGVENGASVHGEETVAVVARGGDAPKRTRRAPAEAGGGATTSRDSLDKGAGEEDGDGGGSQAGAETRAEEKEARATRKGFDGGKPPISGEAGRRTSTEGRWRWRRRRGRASAARERTRRRHWTGDGAGQATEAAREMDGGVGGDGVDWRREVLKWRRCDRNRIGIG
uniref:Ubiquitin-like protease family profile domain-containing protein n=1 Tax=Oryza rufipogon TaxID=4529 RepID=A0A0E0QPQ9_ORYRU